MLRGQRVGINSHEDHGADDSEIEALLASQHTHAYDVYETDCNQMQVLLVSHNAKEALISYDFDITRARVASAHETAVCWSSSKDLMGGDERGS